MTFFSIITPTILRPSLAQACASISSQTFSDWEHIVVLDRHPTTEDHHALIRDISHPQREVIPCVSPCMDGGNTPRHNAWEKVTGEWVLYMDCDNHYADEAVFADLHAVLSPLPEIVQWALFPIIRLGGRFYCDPPRSCHVDTMNFVLRREIARWPSTTAYGSDGLVVDRLMENKISYAAFPDFRPIAFLPKINFCQ